MLTAGERAELQAEAERLLFGAVTDPAAEARLRTINAKLLQDEAESEPVNRHGLPAWLLAAGSAVADQPRGHTRPAGTNRPGIIFY